MLTLMCESKERKCVKDVCCCECAESECKERCTKKIIADCEDFSEDID